MGLIFLVRRVHAAVRRMSVIGKLVMTLGTLSASRPAVP